MDGFPNNRDQWAGMVEAGILPDDYIVLADQSQTNEVVRQRSVIRDIRSHCLKSEVLTTLYLFLSEVMIMGCAHLC